MFLWSFLCFLFVDLTNSKPSDLRWNSAVWLIGAPSDLQRGLRWTQVEVEWTLLISRQSASPSEAPPYIWNARRALWTGCELPRVFPNSACCLPLTASVYIIRVAPGREIKLNNVGCWGNGAIFLADSPNLTLLCVFFFFNLYPTHSE